ncbi:hypothetical protein LCGC14_1762830 [marine sediment metagenome]|uniref:Uncharacterized protein n=1 Tax=marine sediment metagenome TaxID=412755 RepID=A0A0F9HMV9_9ZZZZ
MMEVQGQINQAFGWQDWGMVKIKEVHSGYGLSGKLNFTFAGCWETGQPAMFDYITGEGTGDEIGRIRPSETVALREHFAEPPK